MATLPPDYRFKTAPYRHQRLALEASYKKYAFALFMEPGLGKSKVVIDNAALLFEAGHITGLLVFAPSDVAYQWLAEQIPEHLPTRIAVRQAQWVSSSARAYRLCNELLKPLPRRLHIVAMNYEAIITKKGHDFAKKFLKVHRTFLVADESHEIRTFKAQRSKRLISLAPGAFARRILTGTPTGGQPFDLFSQFNFLEPKIIGYDSYVAFKNRYAQWTKDTALVKLKKTGKTKLVEYPVLIGYRNLPELYDHIDPHVFRWLKADSDDLPERIYTIIPTHLSDVQREAYTNLLGEGLVLLEQAEQGKAVKFVDIAETEDQELVQRLATPKNRMTWSIKLTLLLRLQQVAAGFIVDDERRVILLAPTWEGIPRLVSSVNYLEQVLDSNPGKVIVWSHFRPALLHYAEALVARGIGHIMIHGGVTGRNRQAAINAFKDPKNPARVLVAHPRTMGTGQNLGVAKAAIYYTNHPSLIMRTQSEDRIHRIGGMGAVTIADMVAAGVPADKEAVKKHRAKKDFAEAFMAADSTALKVLMKCST